MLVWLLWLLGDLGELDTLASRVILRPANLLVNASIGDMITNLLEEELDFYALVNLFKVIASEASKDFPGRLSIVYCLLSNLVVAISKACENKQIADRIQYPISVNRCCGRSYWH